MRTKRAKRGTVITADMLAAAKPKTPKGPMLNINHSFGEFLELAKVEPDWVDGSNPSHFVGVIRRTADGAREDFAGVHDYSEAVNMALNGWAEGLAKVNAVKDKIVCALESLQVPRVDFVCADEGVEFDVGRWVERESECWLAESRSEQTSRGRKIIKVVVSISVASAVDRGSITNRGAAIMAAVELLMARGFTVGVEIDFSTEYEGNNASIRIVLKEPNELLEPDRMAFALVHPAMLRCLSFNICEHLGHDRFFQYHNSAYGHCSESFDNRGDLYFDAASINDTGCFNSEPSAAANINALLNQLNANNNQEPT